MQLAIALIVGLTSTTPIRAPSMSTSWSDLTTSQAECIAKGSRAMRAAGLTQNFEVIGENTIYGEVGDYTGAIRCAESKNIVIFIIAGPDVARCRSLRESMKNSFEQ